MKIVLYALFCQELFACAAQFCKVFISLQLDELIWILNFWTSSFQVLRKLSGLVPSYMCALS